MTAGGEYVWLAEKQKNKQREGRQNYQEAPTKGFFPLQTLFNKRYAQCNNLYMDIIMDRSLYVHNKDLCHSVSWVTKINIMSISISVWWLVTEGRPWNRPSTLSCSDYKEDVDSRLPDSLQMHPELLRVNPFLKPCFPVGHLRPDFLTVFKGRCERGLNSLGTSVCVCVLLGICDGFNSFSWVTFVLFALFFVWMHCSSFSRPTHFCFPSS